MKQYLKHYDVHIQWLLGIIVVATAFAVWAIVRLKDNESLTVYEIFPLLGLIAFGLMWTHYVHGATRKLSDKREHGKDAYWYVSSTVVLACLLLHPALLSFGLWRDGLGLPPLSYINAYESMRLAILLGSVSLGIFLTFELHRWFGERPWWKYVDRLQLVAMVAVFIHALSLGGELNVGWYRALWILYGVTLIAAYVYSYRYDRKRGEHESEIK